MCVKNEIIKFLDYRVSTYPVSLVDVADELFYSSVEKQIRNQIFKSKEELTDFLLSSNIKAIKVFRDYVKDINNIYDAIFKQFTYREVIWIGYNFWESDGEDFINEGPGAFYLDEKSQETLYNKIRELAKDDSDFLEVFDRVITSPKDLDDMWWYSVQEAMREAAQENEWFSSDGDPAYYLDAVSAIPNLAKKVAFEVLVWESAEYNNLLNKYYEALNQPQTNRCLLLRFTNLNEVKEFMPD